MSSRLIRGGATAIPIEWRAPVEAERPASLPVPPRDASRELEAAFAEGMRAGRREGEEAASAALNPVMARLARTIEDLSGARHQMHREAEDDVVRLAIAIARRVLNRELTIDPEALLGLARAALDRIDARELQRVLVHPADQKLLDAELKKLCLPKRIEVVADTALERGAALFETTRGTLDASVSTQLNEIERGLADKVARR